MAEEIRIKEANHSDLHELRNLGLISFGQFKDILTPENWEKLRKSLADENTYLNLLNQSKAFIYLSDKKIVGVAYFIANGNPTEIYLPDWCYVRMVGVHPDFSGRGIGRKLMQHCITHAKKTGEKTIALHTSEFMDAARHIYEKLGFIRLREIEPRFGKKYWIYTLEL
ncbi:GNAT family N-acetyltransferase [Dyadobacter subterraneus]|uniref:GNAT family N-acetyltransferase n=1 Tax=Dyadobacter subterraneus TaxID=2773304 RepID=A0ABR9WIL0_9BACT|nr:GNAT family N-acetyltransferase [Dyadobacter subterraneus]MBE9463999.1 GNAT family N-acetyltransferase [Dyadobacter subterraneus]